MNTEPEASSGVFVERDGPNVMRRGKWPPLTEAQKDAVDGVKDFSEALNTLCTGLQQQFPAGARELALAKTNIEQACMWAVKGVTA